MMSLFSFFTPILDTLGVYLGFSVVLSIIIGFVWYSDSTFGPAWRAMTGVSAESAKDPKSMRAPMALLILGALLAAVAVGIFHLFAAPPYSIYLSLGFWVAFGIGTSIGGHAFQRRPWKLYGIDQGYNLAVIISCILMAQILIVPAIRTLMGS